MARVRLVVLIAAGLVGLILGFDVLLSHARLQTISIEAQITPSRVVADGKSSAIITVGVTEKGRPRAGDLLQVWLQSGGGIIRPEMVYTNDHGQAEIRYTPNPANPYDLVDRALIHVADISIGRLVEVDKHFVIELPVEAPSASK